MEETRPTVQEAYLSKAQTMGRDYYQKVTIGGKNYFVMALRGGELTRFPAQTPESTVKANGYAETLFAAQKRAYLEKTGENLSDKPITHIDIEGIKDKDGLIQAHTAAPLTAEEKNSLMEEFDSEKEAIVQHYTQDRPIPVAREAVPLQYRPYLDEAHKDENELYDENAVKHAINHYTLARFNRVKDLVVSSNPGAQESIERQLRGISRAPITFEEVIDQSCDVLRQHMTAQTVWKAMMNVLLPEQLIFVRAPEEEEEFFDCEEEDLSLESNPFGHLDSLDSVPLREREELSGEHRDREEDGSDPFASVTPTPTTGNWLSRFGSYAYSYVPSRTSLPLVGRFFSASTPVSSVNKEDFELGSMRRPSILELNVDYSSDEEEDFFDCEENLFQEPLALHSVHEHEEIRIEPVTARQLVNELTLAVQRVPEGNVPDSSKQAVARTALDKIRSKMKKEENIQAFTENEQRIIREAITRNAQWLSLRGRSRNSELTTILGGLETIAQGH